MVEKTFSEKKNVGYVGTPWTFPVEIWKNNEKWKNDKICDFSSIFQRKLEKKWKVKNGYFLFFLVVYVYEDVFVSVLLCLKNSGSV